MIARIAVVLAVCIASAQAGGWFSGDGVLIGTVRCTNNATIGGTLAVSNSATVGTSFSVSNNISFNGLYDSAINVTQGKTTVQDLDAAYCDVVTVDAHSVTARYITADYDGYFSGPASGLYDFPPSVVLTNDARYLGAWQNPASATNWTWTSDGNEITLTGYTGPNDVVVPDMLDGLPVTGFGTVFSPALAGTAITSISEGLNIASIANNAFRNCTSLTNATLYVSTIAAGAFYGCSALVDVQLPNAKAFPTLVGSSYAFRDCPSLTSAFFEQNAPAETANVFLNSTNVSVYITSPTATGWGTTWNGRPVVRLPVYADNFIQTAGGWTDLSFPVSTIYAFGLTDVEYNAPSNAIIFNTTCNTNFSSDHVWLVGQLPHSAATNAAYVNPHIHFLQSSATQTNMFLIRYKTYKAGGQVPDTWTDLPLTNNAFSYSTGTIHQITYGAGIPGPFGISQNFDIKVWSRGGQACQLKFFDIHYQQDSFGSDQEFSKGF
jgi:hypothetical protein